MLSLDIIFRLLTIVLNILRVLYWLVTKRKANKEKPKETSFTIQGTLERYIFYAAWIVLGVQLLGLDILTFPHNIFIQTVGFIVSVIGILISILGRQELGTNWTHAGEYQIKKNHDLITTGIYRYIRHPIYAGVFLSLIGGELVAESYLVFFFFIISFSAAYYQGKREERILLKHFGKKYEDYMKKTKMFIPFII